jgi:hypothetical protein
LVVCSLAGLAVAACRTDDVLSTLSARVAPYISGVITAGGGRGIVVTRTTPAIRPCQYGEECPNEADVAVYSTTRLVDASGAAADTSALIVGRSVSVWITGTIEESYIPIVGATLITLEN